ncbi:glycosyltransferase involved in cell wall biosynthesis [Pseudorhizobium tarimense]|uniref:Glycosyltransferase involved in cell wall biosynthesis n=1 Tax=Pseudorhizobium tarimense TaxID=1079109 RepID=A0ABV2H5P6_9HYPH|nr:glycosyltransferase [Pseudorhizobium tarimense]MCJ8519274.1 glycosyltransferase [Pseudorhizobium tarimense]
MGEAMPLKKRDRSNPRVSVLVPAFNAEAFLAECLDSILGQDVEGLQIVVSDDASTDRTADILRSYEAGHPTIVHALYQQKNLGIARNCNEILRSCEGQYIALFAGDDVMLPGKLSTQMAYMDAHPDVVMTYHACELFQSETGQTIAVTNTHERLDTNSAGDIITKLGVAAPMSIMLRRSALPENGFDVSFPHACDWLLQISVAAKGSVAKLPGILCRYRKYGVNNGKDLSQYVHEFGEVLKKVRSDFHDRPDIVEACDRGLARFLIGDAFRAPSPALARERIRAAISLCPRPAYHIAYISTFVPGLLQLAYRNRERLKARLG